MALRSERRDAQFDCNRAIGEPVANERKDFALPARQGSDIDRAAVDASSVLEFVDDGFHEVPG